MMDDRDPFGWTQLMPISKPLIVRVRSRFPSLRSLGVAVEHFPCYANRTLCLHAVDVVLFTIALRGGGRHFIDQDAFAMKSGSVGVTALGQQHDILTKGRGMEKFNLYLDVGRPLPPMPTAYQGLLATMVENRRAFRHRLNRGFHFDLENVAQVKQSLHRIRDELVERRTGYAEIVHARLTEVLIDCCRGAAASGLMPSEPQHESFPNWVRTVRSQLDAHYSETWSLVGLAEIHGISVGHLCRTFLSYTGKSVTDYLIDRRITAAMVGLGTSAHKALKVAIDCGFSDYSYFHRQFRRRTGKSPSQYRAATRPRDAAG